MNQKGFANIIVIIGVVILVGIAGYFIVNQQRLAPEPSPSSNPKFTPKSTNFNLIFRYGVTEKNELNTFDETYTKDMIVDPSITIKFKLTDDELADIYQKINDLKLFDKTPVLNTSLQVMPCSSYYLKVQTGSVQKELSWDTCKGEIRGEFSQFRNYIINIIESKDEYRKLPTPKGGYQ